MSVNVDFDWIPFIELLSNIVDNRGKTCPTSDSGIPLIATNCISNETLFPKYEKIRYVSKETYDNWFRGHPIPGDLIFVTKGTPGRVNFTPNPVGFCIAQDMVAIRADEKIIYPKYLFAILRSQGIQRDIENMHVGTLIPHFKKGDFKNLLLPVPEMQHQKTIGDLYFLLSYKIELNRRMNETLESIARAIFTSWFINFDPVRAKAETRQPEGMDAATAALFPSEFEEVEGQEIPKGWQIKPIGDILEVKGGSTPSTENESYWGGNIPFCTPKDLSNSKTPFILSTERTITELGVGEISSGILPIGTVLLSSRAPIGYVSITIAPISINQGFIALIPNESCNNYFIFEWLKANMELIIGNANGTTFLEISKKNFKPLSLCLPPKKLMQAYSLLINPIFTKIKSNLIQNQELSQTRDTLLPKLLSGELPITNPEQFTGVS